MLHASNNYVEMLTCIYTYIWFDYTKVETLEYHRDGRKES